MKRNENFVTIVPGVYKVDDLLSGYRNINKVKHRIIREFFMLPSFFFLTKFTENQYLCFFNIEGKGLLLFIEIIWLPQSSCTR